MNQRLLFSITTPCYNSEKTIERTIKSILNQEYDDYEYIIIDGGSTDGTLDIIKQYVPLFKGKMKWISEPDNGIYDAFNKGVKFSKGVYCWNVNSDDYLEPTALINLKKLIDSFPTNYFPVISAGANIRDSAGAYVRNFIFTKEISMKLLSKDSISFVHPATLIPKEVYEKVGLYDERYMIMGDLDWSRRAFLKGYEIFFVNLFITNMSEGGISDKLNLMKNIKDRKLYFSKFYSNIFVRYYRFFVWLYFYIQGYFVRRFKYGN